MSVCGLNISSVFQSLGECEMIIIGLGCMNVLLDFVVDALAKDYCLTQRQDSVAYWSVGDYARAMILI